MPIPHPLRKDADHKSIHSRIMAKDILSAIVAPVKIGNTEIEGLQTDCGQSLVSAQQIAKNFQIVANNVSRTIQQALNNDCIFFKVKLKGINKQHTPVNALSLEDCLSFIHYLVSKGNVHACLMMGVNAKSKRNARQQGFIYLIQNKNTLNVKIGYSLNPCERLRVLQTATDCELSLLVSINGTLNKEKMLHKKFKQYAIRNEWFLPSLEIMLYFGLVEQKLTYPARDI